MDEASFYPIPPVQRRILGVLVEKQKTSKTAEAYPLTLNSLVVGCNQKSNREPVLNLSEREVEEALPSLQSRGLVTKLSGGRADRWKHRIDEQWSISDAEQAVLAELLLRGPQTVGDLRGRADRMSPIATLEDLQSILQPLAERKLVIFLTDPHRRGAMVTHGFHTVEELEAARSGSAVAVAFTAGADPVQELAALKEEVAALRRDVDELKRQLGQ